MKLREVCKITSGQNAPQASSDYQIGGKTFIKVSDLDNVIFDDNESRSCKVTDDAINEYKLKLFPAGSIVFAKSGLSCVKNRVYLLKKPSYIVNHLCVLYNFKIQINHLWLLYYLKAFNVTKLIKDFSYPSIKLSEIGEIDIPTIPLEKQNKIVEEITELNNLYKNRLSDLNSFDELIKSRFNELFGDPLLNEKRFPTEKLSSACPFNVYKGDVDTIDGKVWLLNLDMIESNTGVILNKLYVDIAEVGNSVIKFDNDCVLYSKLRPYLNKVVVSYGSGYASSELVYMKTGKRIKKEFLANLLRTKSFVDYIDSKSGGAKMPRASMDFLRNFSLIIPPENLQEQFVAFVNQIDKSKFVKIPQ